MYERQRTQTLDLSYFGHINLHKQAFQCGCKLKNTRFKPKIFDISNPVLGEFCWESRSFPLKLCKSVLEKLNTKYENNTDHFFRVFTNSRQISTDLKHFTQIKKNETILDLIHERCNTLSEDGLCFLISNANLLSEEIATFCREFAENLSENLGLTHSAICTLIIGNVKSTPFGIHKDDDYTFYFQLKGAKRANVWNAQNYGFVSQFWGTSPDNKTVKEDFSFNINESEFLFIPRGFPHMLESQSSFSIAPSLGFRECYHPAFQELLNPRILGSNEHGMFNDINSPNLEKRVDSILEKLFSCHSRKKLKEDLFRYFMDIQSEKGFRHPKNSHEKNFSGNVIVFLLNAIETKKIKPLHQNLWVKILSGNLPRS
jgi:hypothetical protein